MARNPERLESFYEEVKQIHKRSFPDWRFGQFLCNFLRWVQTEKGDPFFPEEDKILEYIKEYANTYSPWYRGW
jgi:hypothetical protein